MSDGKIDLLLKTGEWLSYCEKCKAECMNYTPQAGRVLDLDDKIIFIGDIDVNRALRTWRKKKIIRWWVGSDVLLLHKFPVGRGRLSVIKHRLKAWLTEPLIAEHWIYGNQLFAEFKKVWSDRKAQLRLCRAPIDVVEKVTHDGLNIAYYHPRDDKFSRWVYGIDLIEEVMALYPEINWVRLDGTLNPKYFFQTLDGYIRPSRGDGHPRLVQECIVNSVPYYWSENRLPSIEGICHFVEAIKQ